MSNTRLIRAQEIVKDIRKGVNDDDLMRKYRFTPTGLQSVFKQLIDMMAITRAEIYERLAPPAHESRDEAVRVENMRKFPRHVALFPIPIYDAERPHVSGMLRDVSEQGTGVTGLECSVGETRSLLILGDEFVAVAFSTFSFTAVCRWIRTGEDENPYIAGFEITSITDDDAAELRKLVQSLTFCAAGSALWEPEQAPQPSNGIPDDPIPDDPIPD